MVPLATERLSAFVLVPQVVTAILAAWLARRADEAGRKMLLVMAFSALLARSLLFAVDLRPGFLVSVQVLGGLTAAVIGIMTSLVVADLTRQSGRYSSSLGAVAMMGGAGAALSTLTSGFIVQTFGFCSASWLWHALPA